ncbi:MAG: hypothetical protein ACKPAC_17785 [Alphaproteobacteria bacterium]
MDQILVEIALDGRIRYAIGALAGLGFAMVGLALLPQFLAEWPAITPRLLGLGFPILGLGMFLWLSFIPAPHALAIRADGSAVFTRSITTWWRFFDVQETLPPGAIKGVEVELAEAVLGTNNSVDTDTGASSREWRLVLRLADGTMREVQRSPGRASLDQKAAALRGALAAL